MINVFWLIVIILAIIVSFFLLTPFYLSTNFSYCKSQTKGNLLFWFLKQSFFNIGYDFESKEFVYKFMGMKVSKKQKDSQESLSNSKAETAEQNISSKSETAPSVTENAIGKPEEQKETKIQAEYSGEEQKNEYKSQDNFSQISSDSIEKKEYDSKVTFSGDEGKRERKFRKMITSLKNSKYTFFLREKKVFCKIWDWLCRIIKTTLKIVSFERLNLRVKGGVEDPAILGKIYGYTEAFRYSLNLNKKMELEFTPVFMQNYLECSGSVLFNGNLLRFILPFVVAVVTFPYFSALSVWFRYKKFTKSLVKENPTEKGTK